MSIFPPEIIFDILVNLPPKDLITYTCVSKSWYALIHDQHFITAHLQRSLETNSHLTILLRLYNFNEPPSKFISLPFNPDNATSSGTALEIEQPMKCTDDDTDIVGYSHGLVCIHNEYDENPSFGLNRDGYIALWNPLICRFKKIPKTKFEPKDPNSGLKKLQEARYGFKFEPKDPNSGLKKHHEARYGFGYDSVNDDYKVVGVAEFFNTGVVYDHHVQMHSLKSNSWKTVESMPCNCVNLGSYHLVFLNGTLSWLMVDRLDEYRDVIVTLDLATEKYRYFPTPVVQPHNSSTTMDLKVLGGCLCLCVSYERVRHDVWIMREYGVAKSWARLYSIWEVDVPWNINDICKPLIFSNNGEMVLLTDNNQVFYWYDLSKKKFKKFKFHGEISDFERPTICVESLCLLNGGDPVIVEGNQQEASASKKRKLSSGEGVSSSGSQINIR